MTAPSSTPPPRLMYLAQAQSYVHRGADFAFLATCVVPRVGFGGGAWCFANLTFFCERRSRRSRELTKLLAITQECTDVRVMVL